MADDLKGQPGYRVICIAKGPQKGRRILRLLWPEQSELRKLKKLADTAQEADEGAAEAITSDTLGMYKLLATFIPEWDLVSRLGGDLPQPKDDPSVFDKLDSFTLSWFIPAGKDSLWSDVLPNAS